MMITETFNLIDERWIPVKRKSGAEEWIRPSEIVVGQEEDPIVRFNAPRPDFNAGYHQFLIALLQTTAAPVTEREWRKWFNSAPTEQELYEKFSAERDAFHLLGDGPRFMQDLDKGEDWEEEDITVLMFDYPGRQGVKNNTDHFRHKNRDIGLSCAATAVALFNLQSNASSGGRGVRTSIRGGGPFSVFILTNETTWKDLWLSVDSGSSIVNSDCFFKKPFPWLYPTRDSTEGAEIFSKEANELTVFWGMPRRLKLETPTIGRCSLFSFANVFTLFGVRAKAYGNNYESKDWRHPNSCYRKKESDYFPYNPRTPQLGYRNWHLLSYSSPESDVLPAKSLYLGSKRFEELNSVITSWCTGFELDNAKVVTWREQRLPFFCCSVLEQEKLCFAARLLVGWTEKICKILSDRINDSTKGAKISSETLGQIWNLTEQFFFLQIRNVFQASGEIAPSMLISWVRHLERAALKIFDDYLLSGSESTTNPGPIFQNRARLAREIGVSSKAASKHFGMELKEFENGTES